MESWVFIPFESAVQKVTYTKKIPRKQFLTDGAYPIISQESDFINGYWDNSEDVFSVDSPVVIFGDHTKIIKHIDFDFVLGADGVKILKPIETLSSKFFAYFLNAAPVADLGYARHYRLLKEITVPVPPREEQKRIVAILDEAFADIEKVRAKTEQNLKNARELFESYLQQVFSQRGEGWVEYKMSEVCAITSKLIDPKDLEYLDLPHVGAGNMVSGTGELVDVKTAREEGLISGKFSFDSSMVLYSKIRPYLMKVCRPDFSGLCSADVYPLVPIDGLLDKDYLFYLLLSQDFTEYAVSGSGRAGMPKVNRTHLFNYSLSAPSIDSQREYVVKMDQILEYSQALESVYSLKLKSLDELKKSILQKAFSGELTQKNNQGAVA